MSIEIADILDEAANVIKRNGWVQGEFYTPTPDRKPQDCPVCLLGAINIALHTGHPNITEIGRKRPGTWYIAHLVGEHLDVTDVPDWNDTPERTVEQVIAALRGAARAERERAA